MGSDRHRISILQYGADDLHQFRAGDGSLCLRATYNATVPCTWIGKIRVRDQRTAFFDFEIRPIPGLFQFENRLAMIGRGWVERRADGAITGLVFVGGDGRNGLGFVANRASAFNPGSSAIQ